MAKQKEFRLDIGSFSDTFFDKRLLLGISTDWSTVRFCSEMNQKLGINFERNIINDISIRFDSDVSMGLGKPGTLFAEIARSILISFGVFEHPIPFSSDSFFLYSNKEQEFALLTQFPQYSHLLLLPEECVSLYEKPLSDWIEQLAGVDCCEFIDTYQLGKERENLIF